jgi:hypothetical protein
MRFEKTLVRIIKMDELKTEYWIYSFGGKTMAFVMLWILLFMSTLFLFIDKGSSNHYELYIIIPIFSLGAFLIGKRIGLNKASIKIEHSKLKIQYFDLLNYNMSKFIEIPFPEIDYIRKSHLLVHIITIKLMNGKSIKFRKSSGINRSDDFEEFQKFLFLNFKIKESNLKRNKKQFLILALLLWIPIILIFYFLKNKDDAVFLEIPILVGLWFLLELIIYN